MQALSQLSYGPFTVKARSPGQCSRKPWATCGGDPEHSSGPISSLFVTSDITDDVGDVLVALFLVGNEGGIVVVIAFDGLVDLVCRLLLEKKNCIVPPVNQSKVLET